jgi:hypothetical protein
MNGKDTLGKLEAQRARVLAEAARIGREIEYREIMRDLRFILDEWDAMFVDGLVPRNLFGALWADVMMDVVQGIRQDELDVTRLAPVLRDLAA